MPITPTAKKRHKKYGIKRLRQLPSTPPSDAKWLVHGFVARYRWGESTDSRAEVPVDEHNHALAALRYLVARLDKNKLATGAGKAETPGAPSKTPEQLAEEERHRRYSEKLWSDDPRIWRPFG